jgi:tetratricopeptide (TPR) repeat protein
VDSQIVLAKFGNAVVAAERTLLIKPHDPLVEDRLCTAYAYNGEFEKAKNIAMLLGRGELSGDCRAYLAAAAGDRAMAENLMDRNTADYGRNGWSAADLGWSYAVGGFYAKAIRWFYQAYDDRDPTLFVIPFSREIRPEFFKEADWLSLMDKPRMREWKAAHDAVAAQLEAQGIEPK